MRVNWSRLVQTLRFCERVREQLQRCRRLYISSAGLCAEGPMAGHDPVYGFVVCRSG